MSSKNCLKLLISKFVTCCFVNQMSGNKHPVVPLFLPAFSAWLLSKAVGRVVDWRVFSSKCLSHILSMLGAVLLILITEITPAVIPFLRWESHPLFVGKHDQTSCILGGLCAVSSEIGLWSFFFLPPFIGELNVILHSTLKYKGFRKMKFQPFIE